jgi:hypothetical protein
MGPLQRHFSSAFLVVFGAGGAVACAAETVAPPPCEAQEVLVLASDFSSSRVGGARGDGASKLVGGIDLYKDPALARSQGRAFAIARDNDTVLELFPSCGLPNGKPPLSVVASGGRPGSKNPQDVAVAPDGTLWVPSFQQGLVDHLATDGTLLAPIDLSAFDDDKNPQASSAFTAKSAGKDALFVVLERLDDGDLYASTRPSQLARFDAITGAPTGVRDLAARNPFGVAKQDVDDPSVYWLASAGNFDSSSDSAAGIERVDATAFTSTLLVPESLLDGSVVETSVAGRCGAAIVAGATANVNPTRAVLFDAINGGSVRELLPKTPGFDYYGIGITGEKGKHILWIGDRRSVGGRYALHRFALADDCTPTPLADVFIAQKPVALR